MHMTKAERDIYRQALEAAFRKGYKRGIKKGMVRGEQEGQRSIVTAIQAVSPFITPLSVYEKAWSEDAHPRGDNGRFIAKKEIAAAAHDEKKAEKLREKVTDPEQLKKLNAAIDEHKKDMPLPTPKKPTVDRTHSVLTRMSNKPKLSSSDVQEVLNAIQSHTHAELNDIKKRLGIKATGSKSEQAKKIAERLTDRGREDSRKFSHDKVSMGKARSMLEGLKGGQMGDAAKVANVLSRGLTTAELHALRKEFGIKASGTKSELAWKTAQRYLSGQKQPEPVAPEESPVEETAPQQAEVAHEVEPKASKIESADDVGRLLANQHGNKIAGRGARDLQDKWVSSNRFVRMNVPIDAVAPATAIEEGQQSKSEGPIIVDKNKTNMGRHQGAYGAPADVLILDGKHRHAAAKAAGKDTIEAMVGEDAVPHIQAAIAKHSQKKQEINDAVRGYMADPNGQTLRQLRAVASEGEVARIKHAYQEVKAGKPVPHEVLADYPDLQAKPAPSTPQPTPEPATPQASEQTPVEAPKPATPAPANDLESKLKTHVADYLKQQSGKPASTSERNPVAGNAPISDAVRDQRDNAERSGRVASGTADAADVVSQLGGPNATKSQLATRLAKFGVPEKDAMAWIDSLPSTGNAKTGTKQKTYDTLDVAKRLGLYSEPQAASEPIPQAEQAPVQEAKPEAAQENQNASRQNPFRQQHDELQKRIDRLTGGTSHDEAMRNAFPLGTGRPGNASSQRTSAQSSQRIERTIDNAVQAQELIKKRNALKVKADKYDNGMIDHLGRDTEKAQKMASDRQQKVKSANDAIASHMRETLKPGDTVYSHGQALTVKRVNPSGITSEGGSKWKYDELTPKHETENRPMTTRELVDIAKARMASSTPQSTIEPQVPSETAPEAKPEAAQQPTTPTPPPAPEAPKPAEQVPPRRTLAYEGQNRPEYDQHAQQLALTESHADSPEHWDALANAGKRDWLLNAAKKRGLGDAAKKLPAKKIVELLRSQGEPQGAPEAAKPTAESATQTAPAPSSTSESSISPATLKQYTTGISKTPEAPLAASKAYAKQLPQQSRADLQEWTNPHSSPFSGENLPKAIRTGTATAEQKKVYERLLKSVDESPKQSEPVSSYRGERYESKAILAAKLAQLKASMESGGDFQFPTLASASYDPRYPVDDHFTSPTEGLVYHVESKSGLPLDGIVSDIAAGQKEIIHSPNSRYKVVGIEKVPFGRSGVPHTVVRLAEKDGAAPEAAESYNGDKEASPPTQTAEAKPVEQATPATKPVASTPPEPAPKPQGPTKMNTSQLSSVKELEEGGRVVEQKGKKYILVRRGGETAATRKELFAAGYRPVSDMNSGRYAGTPLVKKLGELSNANTEGLADAWAYTGVPYTG